MPTTLQCQDIIFNLLFLTTNSGLFRRGVRGCIVELHDTFIGALWRRLGRRSTRSHYFEARTYITFVIPISRRVSWLRDQWSDADGTVTLKSAYLSRWKHRRPDGFRRETTGAGPMLRRWVETLETLKGTLMYSTDTRRYLPFPKLCLRGCSLEIDFCRLSMRNAGTSGY